MTIQARAIKADKCCMNEEELTHNRTSVKCRAVILWLQNAMHHDMGNPCWSGEAPADAHSLDYHHSYPGTVMSQEADE